MKKDLTELVFIIDRSGSMSGLESDTIGGYNAMLEKQKKEQGEAVITTVLFDDKYELLHDRINIRGVEPITEKDYFVRGSTALLDAVGKTINKIGRVQKHTRRRESQRLCSSPRQMGWKTQAGNYHEKSEMITHQKVKYGCKIISWARTSTRLKPLKVSASAGIWLRIITLTARNQAI